MERPADIVPRIKNLAERYGFLILSSVFLIISFMLLPDYGLGFDSPKNFEEGLINLKYLLTGHVASHHQVTLAYQIHGALFFMITDVCKQILSDSLGWLDPVSARHAFLPVLVFCFMNILYLFLRKRAGTQTAFLTCLFLWTTPHFFGHAFNNIKDIPLFIFFSLSILGFYVWRDSGFQKTHYLYAVFLALGMTFLSKLYAVLIPVLLTLWILALHWIPSRKNNIAEPTPLGNLWTRKNLIHAFWGTLLVLTLLALFFMPAFYAVEEKKIFLTMKGRTLRRLIQNGTRHWSFFPLIQIFYITPVLTLFMAGAGLVKTFVQKTFDDLSVLMLTWFFVVLGIACTPIFPVYTGIRLFMTFLIPFCFFTVGGVTWVAEFLEKISPIKKSWSVWGLGLVLVLVQTAGIAATHPYETTFFNRLAGGLKGAQEKHLPDANDFWLTSYREAVQWINRNAPPNAFVWVPGNDCNYMVRYYLFRPDLKVDYAKQIPFPRNSLVILHRGETPWVNVRKDIRQRIEYEASRMAVVHRIKRQGGEILTIYYEP